MPQHVDTTLQKAKQPTPLVIGQQQKKQHVLKKVKKQFVVQFVYVMCSLVPLVLLVTFAYMMSIVTKSTAASVSVTMGVYFGGSIVHTILMGFLQNRPYITKFLPFNNTDWFSKMFENMIGSDMSLNVLVNGEFFESPTTLCFSAIYVLALLVCMNWIAADSFCRKDIK